MEAAYPDDIDYDESDDDEAPDLIEVVGAALPISSANIPQTACPVTILSGFLGSGKTTLIQYILKSQDHGKRIAVIENEFGEGLAIESLIARDGLDNNNNSLQDLIELPNGCVCCTVKDSLVETLELLLDKRQDLDYILIEASGMADPGPIASVFWLDEALESRLKLDGIVTLVDGKHVLQQLEQTEEAARQIAYADRIVLNKVDLLSETKRTGSDKNIPAIHEVESALRAIHPTAPILKTSFSEIPNLEWILDADCFGGQENLEQVQSGFEQDIPKTETHGHHSHDHHHDENCAVCCHGESVTDDHNHHHHGHEHDHDEHDHETHHHHSNGNDDDHHHGHEHEHRNDHKHKHTASITTLSLDNNGSIDVKKLNAWLADILWPNQDETDTVLSAMLRKQEQGDNDSESKPPEGHATSGKSYATQQQIFRIKGICSVMASDDYEMDVATNDSGLDQRRFIVQAVHDLWDIQPVTSKELFWNTDEPRTCKLVVIGKNLQHKDLKEGFEGCFVQE